MSTTQLANRALRELKGAIESSFVHLDKIASGKTLRETLSGTEIVSLGPGSFTIEINAPQTLNFIQSGRAPGTPPPVGNISSWLASRSLQYSAIATSLGIGKRGIQPVDIFGEIDRRAQVEMDKVFNSEIARRNANIILNRALGLDG